MSAQRQWDSNDSQLRRPQDNSSFQCTNSTPTSQAANSATTIAPSTASTFVVPFQGLNSSTGAATILDFTPVVSDARRYSSYTHSTLPAASTIASNSESSTATPRPESWYSTQNLQPQTWVPNHQLRRSRSQPPRPDPQFCSVLQDSQPRQANMSFTQILPSPAPHFGQGQDFFSTSVYQSYPGYDSMSSMPNQAYYTHISDHRQPVVSPRLLPSSPPYARSNSKVVKASSRSPPSRERTPIKHHRSSVSRVRSSSRPNALLAYVSEQQAQQSANIMPSQSAPSTPALYPQSAYLVTGTSGPEMAQHNYFVPSSAPHSTSQFLPAPSSYAPDINQVSYFGLTRSVSQPVPHEMPALNPQDALYLPNPIPSNSPPLPSLGSSMQSFPPPPSQLESSPEGFRILASRPKPQCFDHGCNGRQFSTFSNLLRHQREKSGSAMKSICPHCGTEFTRTTARNGHLWGGKCKGRGDGQDGPSEDAPSITESE